MVARDYSPATGTFTSLDSVQGGAANPMTMNRYVYALANPATFVDPDGRATCEKDPCQGGGSAVRTPGGTIYGVDSRGRWQRKVASAWDRDETSIPGWAVDACGPSCELAPQMIQVARDYDYFLALYTGCKVDGGGNPSTVLMCLHAQVGDYDVGDAAFYTFFKPSEYDSGGPVAEAVNLIILLLTGREILKGADEGAALAMRALRSERAASAATAIDELFLARFGNLRISIGSGGARVDALRNAGDVSVTGRTPADPLSLDRQIGSSMWQEVSKTKLIEELEAAGASDFKVNQWQELGGGASVVGRNRPDLQFTFGNRRYYVEWDNDPGSALLHEARILLNDPGAMFISFVP
jgi:hypothetical protein